MSTPLRERPDAPLGTLIFRAGLLPAETIESALEEGVKTGKRLGEILVERGLLEEVDLARLLAGQKGLEFVTVREQIVDPGAASLFTPEQARLFRALPYAFENDLPVVAIPDPTDEVLTRNIREALGRDEVRFVVSTRGELAEIVEDVYSKPLTPQAETAPPAPAAEPEPEAPAAETVVEPQPQPVFQPELQPEAEAEEEPAQTVNGNGPSAHLNGAVEPEVVPVAATPAPAEAVSDPEPAPIVPEQPSFAVPVAEQPSTPEPPPAPEPESVPEPPAAPEPPAEPVLNVAPPPVATPEPAPVAEPAPSPEPFSPAAPSSEPAPLHVPAPPAVPVPEPYPPAAAVPALPPAAEVVY
ncbi:MAG: hypothetical protein ACREJR_03925, partial [Candidatus Rokuibacteriota bacterium]